MGGGIALFCANSLEMCVSKHIGVIVIRCLLVVASLLAAGSFVYAQESDHKVYDDKSSTIRFRINKSIIDLEYSDNRASSDSLLAFIDSVGGAAISEITILSYASPDGPYRSNMALAGRRSASIIKMLEEISPELAGKVHIADEDESWSKMYTLVAADTVISDDQRRLVFDIMASGDAPDVKERKIKKIASYPYIKTNILTMLRYSDVIVRYHDRDATRRMYVHSAPRLASQLLSMPAAPSLQIIRAGAGTGDEIFADLPVSVLSDRKEIFYVRTNFLAPLSNVGLEWCIGNNWSVGADWYYPWIFRNPDHKNCFQLLGGGLEGRYWFGQARNEQDRLEGHSVGVNLSAGYYDFERKYTGDQGEFINVGVDYLYSLPICNDKLHLEFTIGLGYIYSYVKPYDVFEPGGKAFKRGYTENFHWVGPTKAGVSLVVPITVKRRAGR